MGNYKEVYPAIQKGITLYQSNTDKSSEVFSEGLVKLPKHTQKLETIAFHINWQQKLIRFTKNISLKTIY